MFERLPPTTHDTREEERMAETDDELEAAITAAGRMSVFATMMANGWGPGTHPPKWVWWQAVHEVRQRTPAPEPQP